MHKLAQRIVISQGARDASGGFRADRKFQCTLKRVLVTRVYVPFMARVSGSPRGPAAASMNGTTHWHSQRASNSHGLAGARTLRSRSSTVLVVNDALAVATIPGVAAGWPWRIAPAIANRGPAHELAAG